MNHQNKKDKNEIEWTDSHLTGILGTAGQAFYHPLPGNGIGSLFVICPFGPFCDPQTGDSESSKLTS